MSLAGRSILVADDQKDVTEALRLLLKSAGARTEEANSPAALLAAAQARDFDLILIDLNYTRDTTSGGEGLELLARLSRMQNPAPIVVMTAWGSMELAVEAVRRGAVDFVMKPFDNTRLLDTLSQRLAEGRSERREEDLALARRTQSRLLPQVAPRIDGLDLAALCDPARAVGGDYYDYFALDEFRTLLLLADVSGKGVPAALLAANLQGAVRSLKSAFRHDPSAAARELHQHLFASTSPEQYAAVFLAIIDTRDASLRYLSAGQPRPMLMSRSTMTRLESTAPPVGLLEQWGPSWQNVTLQPQDRLLVFSDGVDDCGEDLVAESFAATLALPVKEALERIADRIRGAAPVADDLTLLLLGRSV